MRRDVSVLQLLCVVGMNVLGFMDQCISGLGCKAQCDINFELLILGCMVYGC